MDAPASSGPGLGRPVLPHRRDAAPAHAANAGPAQADGPGSLAPAATARAAWLSWLVGLALLAAVVLVALHASEAGSLAAPLAQARPGWLAAAIALQALTYFAQAQVWRGVAHAAGAELPLGAAYRLSLVKLLVDQALPSSGLSGAVVVAGALQRRGLPEPAAIASIVVSACGYAIAYALALLTGLVLLAAREQIGPKTVLAALLFVLAAGVLTAAALRTAGRPRAARERLPRWIARPLQLLMEADPRLARAPRLLLASALLQLAIVGLDSLTVWVLLQSLGTVLPVLSVFAGFMVATLLRTVSIVPGGLGAFEAASVLALHGAGAPLQVALAATLLFRALSFWLPMLPGAWLARGLLRPLRAAPADPQAPAAFWSEPEERLAARLGTEVAGLTAGEAARRLRQYGPNAVEDEPGGVALRLAARQFSSPLVLILLVGAALSLVLRQWVDAGIIFAIVAGSAVLGFTQEFRAGAAVQALRRRLSLVVRVRRDGRDATVPAAQVVPGDVVLLSAGNLVPGDGRVLEAEDLLVSEASLTGESFPVEKRPATLAADTPLSARTNCVWLGTSVRSGTATVLVTATGRATAYGAIAARIAARPGESDFMRGTRQFGQLLMRTMVLVVLLVMAANQLLGRPALESLLFAVALSVGLTPELLPAIVSVTLSRGARAMAECGVIVRRLEAIEDLGSMDILCTDKTGTLTEGRITLQAAVDPEGRPSPEVLRLGYLNAALETGIANPVDASIVEAGTAAGCTLEGVRKVDEIPYDFTRKRLTIVVRESGSPEHLVITKGAFDAIVSVCTMDAQALERCRRYYEQFSAEGLRLIAVAVRRTAPAQRYGHEDECGLTLAGFLLFLDPPKQGVDDTIKVLSGMGIATKVISGDNRHVAAHVARAIGLDPRAMLTGEQLARLKDESLWSLAPRTDLFVEVDPQQKERIVRALQRTGHGVGYLGDGINDAPALHAADVGISVEGAVDVARESADIVLLERDLAVLGRGVESGRATFVNTLKYIGITTSANFGNMISMAAATPLLPFLPLTATQILLNNFISDLPSVAISTDRVDPERLRRAQRWDVAEMRRFMVVFGLLSTLFDLLTFVVLRRVFHAGAPVFQTAWFVVSLLTELAVVLVLRTRGPAWGSRASALLLWTTAGAAVVAVALPYASPVARLFGFVPVGGAPMAAMVAIVLGYVAATEAVKRIFYRGHRIRALAHVAHAP